MTSIPSSPGKKIRKGKGEKGGLGLAGEKLTEDDNPGCCIFGFLVRDGIPRATTTACYTSKRSRESGRGLPS